MIKGGEERRKQKRRLKNTEGGTRRYKDA